MYIVLPFGSITVFNGRICFKSNCDGRCWWLSLRHSRVNLSLSEILFLCYYRPEIAKHMVNALPKPYSGAYLIALGECMMILLTMRIIQFPDVKKAQNPLVSTPLSVTVDNNLSKSGRSLFAIAKQ